MNLHAVLMLFMTGLVPSLLQAQISPGELTRAHEKLEGVDNCTKCHEQGEEITGKKCLDCHAEIRDAIVTKHGYHFQNASSACVNCHKDHIGRDAGITQFDKKSFDHRKTGYLLSGKHTSLACESCHAASRMKDTLVSKNLRQFPHQTYLGLRQQCADCHADRHANSLGSACQNCHTFNGWKPAVVFSHAKTKYPLIGKHESIACVQCHETLKTRDASHSVLFSVKAYDDCNECHKSPHGQKFSMQTCKSCHSPYGWQVVTGFDHSKTAFTLIGKHKTIACEKCHIGLTAKVESAKKDFITKPFKDCTPCHKSPHTASFAEKTCISCHTPQQWSSISEKNFDHTLTLFPLHGKHTSVKCSKCHITEGPQTFKRAFKLAKRLCNDCHEDKHNGQFTQKYGNDCSKCHTEDGYSPSTFTFDQHGKGRFVLSGSHRTIPCRECHVKQRELVFHFRSVVCESCHNDHHEGRFVELMKDKSCDACHVTTSWKVIEFDHARTSFPLIGQHASVACSHCHEKGYKGIGKECAVCHTDPHAGQFSDKGKTDCARCHTPIGRRASVFRHDIHSTFALTGAHAKVECGACHKPQMRNGKLIVLYKPLSSKCESCHQGKI
jgi:hypothetical protein